MSHGGKREGSGRKQGALTKRTQEIAEKALASGKAPLEIMLDNMRHFQQVALDAEAVIEGMNEEQTASLGQTHEEQFKALLAKVKQAAGLRVMAHDCARDAAPYMHSRLQAIEVTGKDGGPVQVQIVGDDAGLL
jgi:biotin synthase-like enzyme